MDPKDAALLVLMFVVFGAPALALAARLTIRPLLDAIDRFREGVAVSSRTPDPRVSALEAEVTRLSAEVQRLSESEAFHRQLQEAPSKHTELPRPSSIE
jgi:HAMP domain-containing protein